MILIMKTIKRMDIKKFRDKRYRNVANRMFLNPRNLHVVNVYFDNGYKDIANGIIEIIDTGRTNKSENELIMIMLKCENIGDYKAPEWEKSPNIIGSLFSKSKDILIRGDGMTLHIQKLFNIDIDDKPKNKLQEAIEKYSDMIKHETLSSGLIYRKLD